MKYRSVPAPDGRDMFSITVIEIMKKSVAVIQSTRSNFRFDSLQRSDNGRYRVLTDGRLREGRTQTSKPWRDAESAGMGSLIPSMSALPSQTVPSAPIRGLGPADEDQCVIKTGL